MGTQVNNLREKQALQAVKDYVDKQGGAIVQRERTTLYTASQATAPNTITLSRPISDFDTIEIGIRDTSGGTSIATIYNSEDIIPNTTNIGGYFGASNYVWYKVGADGKTLTKVTSVGNNSFFHVYGDNHTVKENYSTDEQLIGTWIDGKPLYQKTIDTGALPSTGTSGIFQKEVPHNVQGIERVVDISGYARRPSTGLIMAFNHSLTQSGTVKYVVAVANDTNVSIISAANLSANYTESFVTIKYTKTTDTGGA